MIPITHFLFLGRCWWFCYAGSQMLMALYFEPSRFFLKGKVRQKKPSYVHKHTVREEVSQVWNEHKRRRYKKQSQVLVLGPDKRRLNMNRGTQSFGWRTRL